MELSELTTYAEEKYRIPEQHKWADFPGFSILADPETGKWIALLMRQWDTDTGTQIERCDLKCGREMLTQSPLPYLSPPYRMKGPKWVGIRFEKETDPEIVFRLFDRAVLSDREGTYTFVLEDRQKERADTYKETVLIRPGGPEAFPDRTIPLLPGQRLAEDGFWELSVPDRNVPERIREMMLLYEFGDGSFNQKCRNFLRQGKYMEHYEDDVPWKGELRRYFPTYHDLNVKQLRGYFTWRTYLRKGIFEPVPTSLAYLYVYELLNGIGTVSPAESLRKMEEFERGFLDSGIGDPAMHKNLRRWMLEYAVIHRISREEACRYADPVQTQRDVSIAVLRDPDEHTDDEIISALITFAGKRLEQSPVITGEGTGGKALTASAWRHASKHVFHNGKNLFQVCFGEARLYLWHPLANTVCLEKCNGTDTVYVLNESRRYECRSGVWREKRYEDLYFNTDVLRSLVRAADRTFRKHLKTGHYLKEKPDEAWTEPYLEAVLEEEKKAQLEASRKKITIDFTELNQIRQDARITRNSLLTPEELDEFLLSDQYDKQDRPETALSAEGGDLPVPEAGTGAGDGPVIIPAPDEGNRRIALDETYTKILWALLEGKDVMALLRDRHLMPSVFVDAVNEAVYDEIGDSALEYDGSKILIIEDYREELEEMAGQK